MSSNPIFGKNLRQREDGIWVSQGFADVSFPKEGYTICRSIEQDSFWFRHRNACILAILRAYPPAGSVFDIGGGNGYVSLGMQSGGFDTVLVEPGLAGAVNARSLGLDRVVCSTLEDAGFEDHTLPAAGLFDVLEHIQDDAGFLVRLKAKLAPGGRLYLTVPAYQALWSAEDSAAGHFRRYRLSTLKALLESAGYTVEYASYFFAPLPAPVLLFRTLPTRVGLRVGGNPAQNKCEHQVKNGLFNQLLNRYLGTELWFLSHGGLLFGASCIIVARSPDLPSHR